ncbi:MAG: hypothetical protein JW802_06880 [Campylobacterales bacterium]|nr:hypothetical protein [Campylobacterales bacterium]
MKNLAIGMERYRSIQAIAKAGLGSSPLCALFRYAKIKGVTLFFVFKHDTARFEFKYQKEPILERMRMYYKLHKERMCASNIFFTKIEAVVIAEPKVEEVKREPLVYGERSCGDFAIACTDPKLRMLFESIQQTIKNKPPQKLS